MKWLCILKSRHRKKKKKKKKPIQPRKKQNDAKKAKTERENQNEVNNVLYDQRIKHRRTRRKFSLAANRIMYESTAGQGHSVVEAPRIDTIPAAASTRQYASKPGHIATLGQRSRVSTDVLCLTLVPCPIYGPARGPHPLKPKPTIHNQLEGVGGSL